MQTRNFKTCFLAECEPADLITRVGRSRIEFCLVVGFYIGLDKDGNDMRLCELAPLTSGTFAGVNDVITEPDNVLVDVHLIESVEEIH